jgi:predicted nucleic acid-binding protein
LPDVICNTSPIQYLYQLELLHLLPTLAKHVIVPPAVVEELNQGRAAGFSVPDAMSFDWVELRRPVGLPALPLASDLGPGEAQVLALALESPGCTVILDDRLGRKVARMLRLRLTGTLGVLLDAKRSGLVVALTPLLDRLDDLRFRLAPRTRAAVLRLADEAG